MVVKSCSGQGSFRGTQRRYGAGSGSLQKNELRAGKNDRLPNGSPLRHPQAKVGQLAELHNDQTQKCRINLSQFRVLEPVLFCQGIKDAIRVARNVETRIHGGTPFSPSHGTRGYKRENATC